MTVYLAGLFDSRARLRAERARLIAAGLAVNSTWLDAPEDASYAKPEAPLGQIATKDLDEIDAADLLIVDTLDVTPRGGREFEAGFAVGRGKPVLVIGPARNVFHHLCPRFESWDDLFASEGTLVPT